MKLGNECGEYCPYVRHWSCSLPDGHAGPHEAWETSEVGANPGKSFPQLFWDVRPVGADEHPSNPITWGIEVPTFTTPEEADEWLEAQNV